MNNHLKESLLALFLLGIAPLGLAAEHENGKPATKEIQREAAETAEAIKDYTIDKREEAANKAKAALDRLDADIDALQERIDENWGRMDQATREQAQRTLKTLRKQRIDTAEWYGALKNSTAAAWEHMKKGFSEAYQSLRRASEKAQREYRKNENP